MSLINDALKRAGQKSGQTAAPAPAPIAMRPAETIVSRGLPKFFLPVALAIFCVAILILFKGVTAQKSLRALTQPAVVAARAPAVPPPPQRPVAAPQAAVSARSVAPPVRNASSTPGNTARSQAAPSRVSTASPQPAAIPLAPQRTVPSNTVPAAPASVAAAAPAPAAITYRLGGIFYRVAKPSAVVNNRTVFIGDRVGNARVKSITRDAVTLEFPGGPMVELTL